MGCELLPDGLHQIFNGAQLVPHEINVQVQIFMVQLIYDPFLDDRTQFFDIIYKTGVRIRLTRDSDMEFKIVTMPIFVGTFAKYSLILRTTPGGIVQLVCRIEMFDSGHVNHPQLKFGAKVQSINRFVAAFAEICAMSILIVAATEAEIAPFRQRNPRQTCLITGVGSAITAYQLTETLLSHQFKAAIQVGVAGTLNDSLALGEVVQVMEDQFTDLGSWEQGTFQTLHQLNLASDQAFPFVNGRIVNDSSLVDCINLPKVIGSTVNILTDDVGLLDACHRRVHADVESMEGAAFHYVCRKQHIPFLQIRGISNRVGDRQKNNWKLAEAINNSSMVLEQLVHTLNTRSWN